jgi:hypothetical protein
LIVLSASSAELSAGIASARSRSHSSLICLTSSAFADASASSFDAIVLSRVTSGTLLSITTFSAAVSSLALTSVGLSSSSATCIFFTSVAVSASLPSPLV